MVRDMKYLLVILVMALCLGGNAYGACASAANGNWSAPGTWSGCTGTGGIPGASDVVTGNHNVVINTAAVAASVLWASGTLSVDGTAPHTLTCSTSAAVDCLGTTGGNIDTSAGSATNTLTVVAAGLPSSSACIGHRFSSTSSVVLKYVVVTNCGASAGYGIYLDGRDGNDVGTIDHCDIENQQIAIYIYSPAFATPATYTITNNKFANISTPYGTILFQVGVGGNATVDGNTEVSPASAHNLVYLGGSPVGTYHMGSNWVFGTGSNWLGLYNSNNNTTPDGVFTLNGVYNDDSVSIIGHNVFGLYSPDGTSGHPTVVTNNVCNGVEQCLYWHYGGGNGGLSNSANNVAIAPVSNTGDQGQYFVYGASNITSTHDVAVLGTNNTGHNLFFWIGNGTNTAQNLTIDHATAVGLSPDTGTGSGLQMGEGNTTANLNVLQGQISNSIVSTTTYGILSQNTNNVFVATGTGGVGVFNTDVFNTLTGGSAYTAAGTNFGTSPAHPSGTYGDLINVNPWIYSTTRKLTNCDAILGGPGTIADMGTQFAGRWNGSTTLPLITPSNVWSCMRMAFTPQNPAVGSASSTGSYLGAVQPLLLIGAALP